MAQSECRIISICLFILIMGLLSCQDNSFKNVGDIPFDNLIDDERFKICNEDIIKQYYVRRSSDKPPGYKGEKRQLEKIILEQYNFPKSESENGYLTIRFIVNCKGESGRFRIEEMDFEYQPTTFDQKIKEQLFEIVKGLKDWIPRKRKNKSYDFYQYITFKITDGQIVKILP